jgi:hypothetical protein
MGLLQLHEIEYVRATRVRLGFDAAEPGVVWLVLTNNQDESMAVPNTREQAQSMARALLQWAEGQ